MRSALKPEVTPCLLPWPGKFTALLLYILWKVESSVRIRSTPRFFINLRCRLRMVDHHCVCYRAQVTNTFLVDALEHGLPTAGSLLKILEMAGYLVERSFATDHAFDQGEEYAVGGKLAGFSLNEISLLGFLIEIDITERRVGGK